MNRSGSSAGPASQSTIPRNGMTTFTMSCMSRRPASGAAITATSARRICSGDALAEGFAYQGEVMPYRNKPRGGPSADLPPNAFVGFIQNHDQIGNRAFGERLNALAPPEVIRALASVYLIAPQTPMLFMGEEWGAEQPFPFFCDFHGQLADAIRKGRREEFSHFPEFADPSPGRHDSRSAREIDIPFSETRLEPGRSRSSELLPRGARGAA